METKKILDSVFEGNNLTTAIWGNKIVWLASEISLALGYSRPGRVSTMVSGKWANDFVDGEDYQVLTGDKFQKFARFDDPQEGSSNRLSKRARRTMLLTESGLNLVIINTRKPVGVRLRRHISSVVLPQFRRGMIQERPVAELEARYQKELLDLSRKLVQRDDLLLKRDQQLIDANYRLGIMDASSGKIRKSASAAGSCLAAHKGTKKLRSLN